MVLSNNDDSSSVSLVTAALSEKVATTPLIPVPENPDYIYPVSSFPALSSFDISIKYPAIIAPARRTSELRKSLKGLLLNRPKLKIVYTLSETDSTPKPNDSRNKYRKLLLADRPNIFDSLELKDLLESGEGTKGEHTVTVSYSDWTVDEVLRRMLPVTEVPSAFEIIGHLAHINLREELLPYKLLIGKVVLDKNAPRIKTIVNKIGTIDTKFRTFGMEVIAGNEEEGWSQVTVKEEGCQYLLDFRKVYWNSRLAGEHRRLVDVIRQDMRQRRTETVVVADLMAGIGPFAIPLTSKGYGIHVHANDLNPSSYKYLVINNKKNKCERLSCYNMDARGFCHHLQDQGVEFHHVLMNLPATAPEFLDAFRGFRGKLLPRIHVHCFGPKGCKESEKEAIDRCSAALGTSLNVEEHDVSVHLVRDVAPKKNMYCVSFNLPPAVRGLPRIQIGDHQETEEKHDSKRTKLN